MQKTITLKIRLWTNGISLANDVDRRKHAKTKGTVSMERNDTHGIVPTKRFHFQSLLGLGGAVERLLIEHGIKLHPSEQMRRYWKE
jgi:hypothetical protein